MFLSSLREFRKTRSITLCAILIALGVLLSFVGVKTGIIDVTFAFVAEAALGFLLGPFGAVLGGAAIDTIAFFVRPQTGPLFPGFTLSAMLTGLVFALFLYRKPLKTWRIIASKAIINLFINTILNSVWLYVLSGAGVWANFPVRALKNLVCFPIEVLVIVLVLKALDSLRRQQ